MTTATTQSPKNGTARKAPAKTQNKPDEQNMAALATTPEMARELRVAETAEKVTHLKHLLDMRTGLIEKRSALRWFKPGADDSYPTLILCDREGNEFKTSNASLIAKMTEQLEKLFTSKIDEISEQLLAFKF